mmetsp:Transcript_62963/g.205507  ORF Transcript_62963/g.205507 Transcript_62963/m.205507 type:complete len:171 (+) Transcript_62963:120-632(+)
MRRRWWWSHCHRENGCGGRFPDPRLFPPAPTQEEKQSHKWPAAMDTDDLREDQESEEEKALQGDMVSNDVAEQGCWRPWTTKEPCVGVPTQEPVLPVVAILRYGWQGRLTSGRRNLTATSDTGPDRRDEASFGEPDRRLGDRRESDQLPERHREDAAEAGEPHDSVAPGV